METATIVACASVILLLGVLVSALRYRYGLVLERAERGTGELIAVLKERVGLREGRLVELDHEIRVLRSALEAKDAALKGAASDARAAEARLKAAEDTHTVQLAQWNDAEKKLGDTFRALSLDALRTNTSTFMSLAADSLRTFQEAAREDSRGREVHLKQLVDPLKVSLEKVDGKIRELEATREGAYRGLAQQVQALLESQNNLRQETANLTNALKSPVSRGRWGEVQLKRVVELAGMVAHCDFYEQRSATGEDGMKRPDMVVKLPGDKHIVIDAKAPLAAFLEAMDAPDDERRRSKMREHAMSVRRHIHSLSQKAYWDQFQPAPEFVVLFLPGETFYSAALEQDPSLIEIVADHRVILATPTTLIALLRAVHYGWRQEAVAENAREVSDLGRELYQRVADMAQHLGELGRTLGQTVNHFNKTVGTFETRVLVSARRFKELKVDDPKKELHILEEVDVTPRLLRD